MLILASVVSEDQKIMLDPFQLSGLEECNGSIDNAISIMMQMLVLNVSHDTKCLFVLYFDHCVLRNAMVPLLMALASCDADGSVIAIT